MIMQRLNHNELLARRMNEDDENVTYLEDGEINDLLKDIYTHIKQNGYDYDACDTGLFYKQCSDNVDEWEIIMKNEMPKAMAGLCDDVDFLVKLRDCM